MFPIEGRLVARPRAPYHLFVGDETAAVCFGAILRGLRDDAPVFGAIEAAAPAARLPLPRGDRLTRIERDDAAAPSPSAALVDAVRGLELPPGPGAAYLAGEAKTVQAVRRHLIHDRGWSRTDIRAKAFWAPGKRGLD
jgi:NADPH-dependent ferric siderophore reductase